MNDQNFIAKVSSIYVEGNDPNDYQELAAVPMTGMLKPEQITPENMRTLSDVCRDGVLTNEEKARITPFLSASMITGIFGDNGKRLQDLRVKAYQKQFQEEVPESGTLNVIFAHNFDRPQLESLINTCAARINVLRTQYPAARQGLKALLRRYYDENEMPQLPLYFACTHTDYKIIHHPENKENKLRDDIIGYLHTAFELTKATDTCPAALKGTVRALLASPVMSHDLAGHCPSLLYYFRKWGEAADIPVAIRLADSKETETSQFGLTILGVLGVQSPAAADELKRRIEGSTEIDYTYRVALHALQSTGRHQEFVRDFINKLPAVQ